MLTRCPSCATTFRITPEQLKARQGRVRCGQCQAVFDALDTLVDEVAAAAPVATPTTIPPASADAASASPGAVAAVTEPLAPSPAESAAEPAPETPALSPGEPYIADEAPPPFADDMPPLAPQAAMPFGDLAVAERPRRAWPWAVGALCAVLALAFQAIIHFRVDIAVAAPETKPLLGELCAALGCELPLPAKTELVSIEASDLHPDSQKPGRLQLSATIKNRAPHAQQYPHLELTLTDTNDTVLLRRVLAPPDYLPRALPLAAGFAAGADLAVTLALEVKDLAPVGYRLYVFYP